MVMKTGPGEWLPVALALFSILVSPYIHPPWFVAVVVILISLILYLIPDTQIFSLAAILISVLYGLNIIPLFIYSVTFAILVCGLLIFRSRNEEPRFYLYYLGAASGSAVLIMAYLGETYALPVLFGIVVAVLLKAIWRGREDGLAVEALGIAMTMVLILDLNYQVDMALIALAVIIAFSFGYISYRFRTADLSGLFSGALVGIILIIFTWESYGIRWFFIMLAFFIIGSVCTRYRFDYKEKLGVEQSGGGARGYRNVFGNGIVSAAAAVLYGVTGQPLFVAMFVGSVASATADTVASEIGVTGGSPYLITTLERVPPGTNGGVTLMGETVALVSAGTISLLAFLLGVIDPVTAVACALAGLVGTNLDSIAGATVENRGIIGNAGTNVIGTLGGGLFALAVFSLLFR
jgi:uncharacterized protein (TIGR00297 family)